jgi:hypothetical protein
MRSTRPAHIIFFDLICIVARIKVRRNGKKTKGEVKHIKEREIKVEVVEKRKRKIRRKMKDKYQGLMPYPYLYCLVNHHPTIPDCPYDLDLQAGGSNIFFLTFHTQFINLPRD